MNSDFVIEKYGKDVRLIGKDGWKSPTFKAFIQPYQASNGSVMCEKKNTYIIFCPRRHNIARLDNLNDYRFVIHSSKYKIIKAETVCECGMDIYHFGIIEKVTEDEYF